MKWRTMTFAFALSICAQGIAGTKIVRTGGDILECEHWVDVPAREDGSAAYSFQNGFEYHSLDIHTNAIFRGIKPVPEDLGGDEVARARQLIARLKKLDPARERLLQTYVDEWKANSVFEDKLELEIEDSANFIEGLNCRPVQLIIQEHNGAGVRYRVDMRYWPKLDVNNRAYMIVHEAVYRDAFTYGQINSFYVAYFNALIAADRIKTMDQLEYERVISELGFRK